MAYLLHRVEAELVAKMPLVDAGEIGIELNAALGIGALDMLDLPSESAGHP